MKKDSNLIGIIYMYLFSIVGLVLIVIGSAGLINIGLKTFVFDTQDPWVAQPPMPYWSNKVEVLTTCEDLSVEDKQLMSQWLQEYAAWEKDSQGKYDRYRNGESAARNLALLLVGIPLFVFHWRLRKKYD